jgi:hypothetical protein
MQHMVRFVIVTTNCREWRVPVSLPLIPVLLDGQKYFLPGASPAADEKPNAQPRQLGAPRPGFKAWAELGARLIAAD